MLHSVPLSVQHIVGNNYLMRSWHDVNRATLHVETKEVLKLLRTENTQIPQLEEEIGALKEKITMEEVKRQKRREQHQVI